MSEEPDSHPHERRSWLERLSLAFSGEPRTREDLIEILRDARENGLIGSDTLKMLEGALAVSELQVGDIMLTRSQMVSLPADEPFMELMKMVVESGLSRFPVHGEDKDEILGILLAKDLLRGIVTDGGPGQIRELLRPRY
jgi:magnesium and cobalt transporter